MGIADECEALLPMAQLVAEEMSFESEWNSTSTTCPLYVILLNLCTKNYVKSLAILSKVDIISHYYKPFAGGYTHHLLDIR